METIDQEVRDYLKSDRQWTRALRLAHATYNLQLAEDMDGAAAEFWSKVVKALEY